MEDSGASRSESAARTKPVTVGVLAAPGVAFELAEEVADKLPQRLEEQFPDVEWRVEGSEAHPAEPSANTQELIDTVRRHLIDRNWQLAIGLTDLPLRSGHRPVTAHASATHGVGL